jgi:hexosaminidase
MNRLGEKGAVEQIRKGLDIVLAPGGQGLYFDYAQSASELEPSSHGGNAPVWKSFVYDPEYGALTAEEKKHILGVEACIWTEHIATDAKLYYMIVPRLFGLAQTAWAAQGNKTWSVFAAQVLPAYLERFDKAGSNYRVPTAIEPLDTTIVTAAYTFETKAPFATANVYYTLNNKMPGEADHRYTGPVSIPVPPGKKITVKTIVITPAGRRSVVTRTVLASPEKAVATDK